MSKNPPINQQAEPSDSDDHFSENSSDGSSTDIESDHPERLPSKSQSIKVKGAPKTERDRMKLASSITRSLAAEVDNIPLLTGHETYLNFKSSMIQALQFREWSDVVLGKLKRDQLCSSEQAKWDWVDKWAKWMLIRRIDPGLLRRENFNDYSLSSSELWKRINHAVGQITPEMIINMECEMELIKLKDGENPRVHFDKMKEQRDKMNNFGLEVTDTKFLTLIIKSLPVSLFITTRFLLKQNGLTSTEFMNEVNAIYDGMKLRGEFSEPTTTLAVIDHSGNTPNVKLKSHQPKRCDRCGKSHGDKCWKWDSESASRGWRAYFGEWKEGKQVKRGKKDYKKRKFEAVSAGSESESSNTNEGVAKKDNVNKSMGKIRSKV